MQKMAARSGRHFIVSKNYLAILGIDQDACSPAVDRTMPEAKPVDLKIYETIDGARPFEDWLDTLRDRTARIRIKQRLNRVGLGNLGDFKSVGDGVFEFRVDHGPGYRLYFSHVGEAILLLLCGGNKNNQNNDILQAQQFWTDYKRRENANE
jgi:putative addiction module killer protein